MKVDALVPVKDHAHIQARFNLKLAEGVTIRDIRLMAGSKGRWISWPSRPYKDKEGKDKYFDYIALDKETKEKTESDIKAQIDKILNPQGKEDLLDEVPF